MPLTFPQMIRITGTFSLREAAGFLNDIFSLRERSFPDKKSVQEASSFSVLLMHLPYLPSACIFSYLSASLWSGSFRFSPVQALMPALAVSGILAMALVFDKISEFSAGPGREDAAAPYRNAALFFHLPVSASAVFYIIHPAFGYFMTAASAVLALFFTFRFHSFYNGRTAAGSIILYLWAAVLFVIPLFLLSFVFSLIQAAFLAGEIF